MTRTRPARKPLPAASPLLRAAGLVVKVLVVPDGKDPDEFLRAHGKDAHAQFQSLLDHCGNDVAYQLGRLKAQQNVQTPEGKVAYLNAAAGVLAGLDNELEREVYAGRLADECGVQRAAVLAQVESVRKSRRRTQDRRAFRTFQQKTAGTARRGQPGQAPELPCRPRGRGPARGHARLSRVRGATCSPGRRRKSGSTAFNRRVYSLIAGKMKDGGEVRLADLGEDLTREEMDTVAGYCARRRGLAPGEKELDDCHADDR